LTEKRAHHVGECRSSFGISEVCIDQHGDRLEIRTFVSLFAVGVLAQLLAISWSSCGRGTERRRRLVGSALDPWLCVISVNSASSTSPFHSEVALANHSKSARADRPRAAPVHTEDCRPPSPDHDEADGFDHGYREPVERGLRAAVMSVIHGESAIGPSVVSGAIVAITSYLIGSKRGDIRVDVALASIASFLFGILMAFTIVRTRERLALVQNLVSKGNASLLAIFNLVEVFSEDVRSIIRDLIDRQLTDQIDYRLVDNYLSAPSHLALTNAVISLEPGTPKQEIVYKEAVEICIDMGSNRALIEAASGQSLSPMEWTGLLLLLLLLMALIAVLPGGTLWGALVAGVMAGTLVTLIVLLRKLDRLRWHERSSIWEPTARLFRSMGRDPYVPREVIDSGRYCPTGRVRVADYPDPYPNRTRKIVTTEDFGQIATSRNMTRTVSRDLADGSLD
jgi:hypothetical protein